MKLDASSNNVKLLTCDGFVLLIMIEIYGKRETFCLFVKNLGGLGPHAHAHAPIDSH